MRETYEKYMKQNYITFDYTGVYGDYDNPLHIVDETRLVIDDISSHKFQYHLSPLYGKGYLRQGYMEAPPSLFYDITRLMKCLKKVGFSDELKLIYSDLEIQVNELSTIYNNVEILKPTPYEVVGLYFMSDIRSSRIFRKYDFQVPKDFLSDVLRFLMLLEHVKLNKAIKYYTQKITQEIMELIADREKTFRKVRKNLVRYIDDITSTYSRFKHYEPVTDALICEKKVRERCITILISIPCLNPE